MLTLASFALALASCVPGSLSLGDDGPAETDTDTGEPAPEGVIRWSTIRPDTSARSLAVAPDGSFYVLGQSGFNFAGDGGYYDDLWLGKHDASGALLWEIFEPLDPDSAIVPVGVAVDDAGNPYIAILDYSAPEGGGNHVRRLDPNGNEQWRTTLPGNTTALAAQPGGGVVVGGAQDSVAWVQAIDATGTLGWSRTFGDPSMRYSTIQAMSLTPDGAVALGGTMGIEPDSSRSRAWAAVVERADGSTRWETPLSDGVISDWIRDLGVAADGTMLLAGWTDERWVQAVGSDGSAQWTWINELAPGTDTLAVFPDSGFAVGDGRLSDPDVDGNAACWENFSPCPVAMRIARLEADRTLRWALETDECFLAQVLRPTADGGLLAVASCRVPGSSVAMGVFQLEP